VVGSPSPETAPAPARRDPEVTSRWGGVPPERRPHRRDRAPVRLDDQFGDGEAEPLAAGRAVARGVGTVERAEDRCALGAQNARTIVVDCDAAGAASCLDSHLSVIGVGYRVPDEVREHAPKGHGIALFPTANPTARLILNSARATATIDTLRFARDDEQRIEVDRNLVVAELCITRPRRRPRAQAAFSKPLHAALNSACQIVIPPSLSRNFTRFGNALIASLRLPLSVGLTSKARPAK
jgi:hypothetical protein